MLPNLAQACMIDLQLHGGWTPLQYACAIGNLAACKSILDFGAEATAQTVSWWIASEMSDNSSGLVAVGCTELLAPWSTFWAQ
jgi:ankyrin repeat protein